MKEFFGVVATLIAVAVATVLIMVYGFGVEMFGLSLQKHVENKRTDVTRQTNQYRTTQETKLANLMQAWNDAETKAAEYKDDPNAFTAIRAQQAGIVRQMKTFVNSGQIAKENVPQDIADFLATH